MSHNPIATSVPPARHRSVRVGARSVLLLLAIAIVLLACKRLGKAIKEESTTASPEVGAGNQGAAQAAPASTLAWKTHESAPGGFEIEMPGTPKADVQDTPTAVGSIKLHMFIVESSGGNAFTAMYSDYPDALIKMSNADKILMGAQEGGVTNIKGTLQTQKKIEIDGHPGREFSALAPTPIGRDIEYKSRVYLVANRLYQVAIASMPGTVTESDKNKFFDSFKLTK